MQLKKVRMLPIQIVESKVSSLDLSDEGRLYARNVRLYTIHIGSTPTFLYFDLYLNTAYDYWH